MDDKSAEHIKEVQAFLATPLPLGWADWDLKRRREFWRGARSGGEVPRRRVCGLEIWEELFERDRK